MVKLMVELSADSSSLSKVLIGLVESDNIVTGMEPESTTTAGLEWKSVRDSVTSSVSSVLDINC